MPRIPNYDLELRLREAVAGQIHTRYPLNPDDLVQRRVQEAGERVLKGWVTPLKGYRYRFHAVESDLPNAFAAPAGRIYITTGLLEALESDEELEAVLAHEIAHVEFRHGYRQFRTAQKAAFWAGLAAAFAAAAARKQPATSLAVAFSELAGAIVLAGHSRRYEAEADAVATFYFENTRGSQAREQFAQVLRKLEYHQDFFDPYDDGGGFLNTHPEISGRIDAVMNSKFAAFGGDEVFYGYNSNGDLVATVSFQGQCVYTGAKNVDDIGLQVIALVGTTAALGDKDEVSSIKLHSGGRKIKLDNREDTEILPNDVVGASFVSKTMRALLQSIDATELDLRNVKRWQKEPAAEE